MVTIYSKTNQYTNSDNRQVATYEFRGDSTDTKPTADGDNIIENGSVFIEIDTGTVFIYSRDNEEWNEV